MSEGVILAQLDESARSFTFPMLNNIDLYHAGLRMTAFRGAAEWLLAIEEVALFEEYSFQNIVSGFGNRCDSGPQLAIDDIIAAPPGQSVWREGHGLDLSLSDFTIVVGGEERRFTPDPADYEPYGDEDSTPAPARVLRYLHANVPGGFFQSTDTLLEACGRGDADLEVFLRLDDWAHPDVIEGQLPSDTPTFLGLARALSENDPALYDCPPEQYNTHWSNWPRVE